MKVHVEQCYGGGEHFYFRLTIFSSGGECREHVRGDRWTRETAADALDLLERVYHVDRRTVRFVHH